MKTKKSFYFVWMFAMFLGMLFVSKSNAQVTIGAEEDPISGTLMQLKNIEGISDNSENAYLGLGLPRVALSDKNELYPMFLQNPDDPSSGPNAEYAANKAMLDKTHAGLIVYNTVEDDDKELCLGLNQWNGKGWNCFEEKMGNAKFDPVNCSDIEVNGEYIEGAPATSNNFLSIRLNVIKPGAYTIIARTDNGYSFFYSGVALSLGEMIVYVPCQGTPTNVQVDKLIFTGIDLAVGCEPEVSVVSAVAIYSLNCSSITVNGQYLKGRALVGTSNTITISTTVAKEGSYHISVPSTYGVSFAAIGSFAAPGTYLITLFGSGTPTVNFDFEVEIHSNTPSGNNNCVALVPVTLPAMTYAIIGQNIWSWAASARRTALDNGDSFGPNGIVKILRLSQAWSTASVGTATTNLNSTTMAKPDVVLYFAFDAAPSTALSNALANYIRQGGCVIYGSADGTSTQVNLLMDGIFNVGTSTAIAQAGGSSDDNVYPINILPECQIVNGPFGNLGGRHWGEDNAQTGSVIMTSLPPNSVQIASARSESNITRSPAHSIVWYNESMNFLYIGDSTGATSGPTSGQSTGDLNSDEAYPTIFTPSGLPLSKNYGPAPAAGANKRWVFNSALELNGVAWALRKAAVSGINPH